MWDWLEPLNTNNGTVKNISTLQEIWNDIAKYILDRDTVTNQVHYLKTTPKPRNMGVRSWIMRIRSINAYIDIMEIDISTAEEMTYAELVKEVIAPNLPETWIGKWEMMGGTDCDSTIYSIPKLEVIELEEKEKQVRGKPTIRSPIKRRKLPKVTKVKQGTLPIRINSCFTRTATMNGPSASSI